MCNLEVWFSDCSWVSVCRRHEPSAPRRLPHVHREKITDHAAEFSKESHHGEARDIFHDKSGYSRCGKAVGEHHGEGRRPRRCSTHSKTDRQSYREAYRPTDSPTDGPTYGEINRQAEGVRVCSC